MKKWMLRLLAISGLVLTILPSVITFYDRIPPAANKTLMAVGMALWFLSAPCWYAKKAKKQAQQTNKKQV